MTETKSSSSESDSNSITSWCGRTDDGQPVQRGIGDTAHSGADATYDGDAYTREDYDPSEHQQPKEYDGDARHGSDFYRADVAKHVSDPEKRRQFERMWMWNDGANPSYENGDDPAVQPADDTGRRALKRKLAEVEWICDELGAPPAVRSEARTLVASANGRGHCIEKVALGAVLVADDRFLRNKVARADVDGPLSEATERLQTTESDREIDTILNLLEGQESLEGVFARRMKRWDGVEELADRYGFKLSDAKAVFYDE